MTNDQGLVQSVRHLEDGSGLAVTIAKYFTPLNHDINKHGIEPDVKVELTDAQRQNLWLHERDKIGTLQDPQFAKAVEVLGRKISSPLPSLASKKGTPVWIASLAKAKRPHSIWRCFFENAIAHPS